jgi:hypothetical protein
VADELRSDHSDVQDNAENQSELDKSITELKVIPSPATHDDTIVGDDNQNVALDDSIAELRVIPFPATPISQSECKCKKEVEALQKSLQICAEFWPS